MAQLISTETMATLHKAAADLVSESLRAAEAMVLVDEGATEDEIAQAIAVNAVTLAVSAILQSIPLNQLGVMAAMGTVSGTVLGQCVGDRAVLYAGFQKQMAATLAEVAAARMTPVGTA